MNAKYTPKLVLALLQIREMLDAAKLPVGYSLPEMSEAHLDYVERLQQIAGSVEDQLIAEGWKNEESLAELKAIARLA